MSAKCKVCGSRIFDEDGQCYGIEFPRGSGEWICSDSDCPGMVTFVRVNKHPDHCQFTWFRLFIDGELVTSFSIPDEYADRFEGGVALTIPDVAGGQCNGCGQIYDKLFCKYCAIGRPPPR